MKRLLVSLILALSLALPVAAQVVEDQSAGGASSGSTVGGCSAITAILNVVSGTLACNPASVVNGTVSTAGRSILTIQDTISGSSATSNFLNITGTFPASISVDNAAVNLVTANGGDAGNSDEFGLFSQMSGSSGASAKMSIPVFGRTTTSGSGVNAGVAGEAFVNSASKNAMGVYGGASSGNSNSGILVGVFGGTGSNSATPTNAIGVWGDAPSTGTNRIGGYFRLTTGTYSTQLGLMSQITTAPSGIAALVADNGSQAQNIFEARDNGSAVFTIADGGNITGTGTYTFPAGAAGSPSVIVGAGGGGLYARTGGVLSVNTGSGGVFEFNASDFWGISTGRIGFTNGALNGTFDTFFRRGGAAATMQMGSDANGAPTDQTIQSHNGITGTDIKGAALNLRPGLGTGAAVSNPLTLNRVVTKATGTTAQTYSPSFVACPTKILSNTSATTQTVATITTTSTTGGSVTMDYSVVANNGTLQNVDGGMVKVAWGNNAGTVTSTMTAVALQADADASGTLAATPTRTDATNVISIKLTPTWVTIVPTTVTAWITFTLHTSGDTVACQ